MQRCGRQQGCNHYRQFSVMGAAGTVYHGANTDLTPDFPESLKDLEFLREKQELLELFGFPITWAK